MQQSFIHVPIIAILIIQLFALLVREFLRTKLGDAGVATDFAKDLSYLVVPALLAVMLLPIFRSNWPPFSKLLSLTRVDLRLVLAAFAIGFLARVAWWSGLILQASLGLTTDSAAAAIEGPHFWFDCPPPVAFVTGLVVWIVLVPVTEEAIHRGLIQSTLMQRGRHFAIVCSALLFAVFHSPSGMLLAFVLGLVFGLQFANTKTLWTTIVTHATYDGLIQFDWRCLHGAWNPRPEDLPYTGTGIVSSFGLIACVALIIGLLTKTGAREATLPQ